MTERMSFRGMTLAFAVLALGALGACDETTTETDAGPVDTG